MRRKTHPAARALAGLLILGSLGTVFLEWIGIRFISMQFSFYDVFSNSLDNSFGSDTEETLIVAMGAVLALTGLIGLVCAFSGSKGGVFPYLVASALYLGLAVYLVEGANREAYGIGVAAIGVGAWLCPALAAAALLCMFIPESAPAFYPPYREIGGDGTFSTGGSFCSNCGEPLQRGSAFCSSCGTRV